MGDSDKIQDIHNKFSSSEYPETHNSIESSEIRLTMGDGVNLRTFISRPVSDDESYPAILVRTPYKDLEDWYKAIAVEYAHRGFAFITQFCRGTGGSEGEWEPNVNERRDGKNTIDWVCSQAWVENVGYMGVSYMALTGWIIADILPEKVKTMYLSNYGVFRHISAYKDGLFRHDVLTAWAMENAGYDVKADYLETCKYQPHCDVSGNLWGKHLEWYKKWVTSTDGDDEYWNEGVWGILKTIPQKVKIPLLISEGWYDHHLGSGLLSYHALSDECRKKSKLVVGPWDHWFDVPIQGHIGKNYENNDLIRSFKWFYDLQVKKDNHDTGVSSYVIGGDYWIDQADYNLENQEILELYFNMEKERKELTPMITSLEKNHTFSFQYNPDDPVPSWGAESMLKTREAIGSLLQPGPDYREDVISFISSTLHQDITVWGKINVLLYVSTDVEDTSFSVKIMNILKDGSSYNVRSGITTLGYRNNSKKRVGYKPGEIVEVNIDLWDIAFQFKKGSQLRIDIQSSDFPQYSIHPNLPGVWSEQITKKKAKQNFYMGKDYPSRVILPVITTEKIDK